MTTESVTKLVMAQAADIQFLREQLSGHFWLEKAGQGGSFSSKFCENMLKLVVTRIKLGNTNTTGRKSSCKFCAYAFDKML